MSAYCHKKTFQLRYTDVDYKDELSLSALLSMAQEAACSSADELGFGYDDLKCRNLGFLVVNSYGEIASQPKLGENVTVETWPLPPRRVFFERHYRVRGEDGRVIAALASRWCLVNLKTFSMCTPEVLGETHTNCPYNAEKSVSSPAWRIEKLGETGRLAYETTVRNSHCDHYLHANNTRYADFFLDAFSMDELSERVLKRFTITYHKQAKEGAKLQVLRKDEDGSSVLEVRCDGETLTQCFLDFEKRI